MIVNPFPGPQPYRASDRNRFHGRDDLSYKLEGSILANRCVTVYGPSGAGKSSLVQASVIPSLIEAHEIRVVRVDSWPEEEDPMLWLAEAVYKDLGLGGSPAARAIPGTDGVTSLSLLGEAQRQAPDEAIFKAAQRAARRSPRLVLIYLDQIEQLLYPYRFTDQVGAFFDCVHRLAEMPLRNLRMVLSLREDYLGRFRDRLRNLRMLLEHGFRVGPLTVGEICDAVCKAAEGGEPPQHWMPHQMRSLLRQVRVPGQAESDEAEAQAAYAQIVCRALFQEQAQAGNTGTPTDIAAEPIMQRYFEATLQELGPMRQSAQRLLEDHLITADGGRTVRTEHELGRLVPSEHLSHVLKHLEGAAILHAEEHQGSRYFELGHDWLARKVHEERQARERDEEQRRREEEQRQALERERAQTEARLDEERKRRRTFRVIAILSLMVAVVTAVFGGVAWKEKHAVEAARRIAEEQRQIAREEQIEAHDARVLAMGRELALQDRLPWAMKLLLEVKHPEQRHGFIEFANGALNTNAMRVTLRGHQAPLSAAVFSPDGKRILTASADGNANVWNSDGSSAPIVLAGHTGSIISAAFSADGQRVLTASDDGTARVWNAGGAGPPVVLKGHEKAVVFAAFSLDARRVVTASDDGTARVWNADGSGTTRVLKGHEGPISCALFHPDGVRVITASVDGTVRLWDGSDNGGHVPLRDHSDHVVYLAISPDGKRVVSASYDNTARIWEMSGKGKPIVLEGHASDVYHAAFSPNGRFVATASADRTARVWRSDGQGTPVVLKGHTLPVHHVAWSPDGRHLATASGDGTARLWHVDGGHAPLVLSGHLASVQMVAWSPDGTKVVTAAGDGKMGALSATAKVWSTERLKSIPGEDRDNAFFHSVSISAEGKQLAAAFDDNTARLWNATGTEKPVVFRGHEGWVASASISRDGKRVVTASFDKTARVWTADGSGEPIVLKGHEAPLRYAAFSPDGRRVVTVSQDNTARVWNADGSGAPVVLKGHEDWLVSAAFSQDGRRIVTASLDRTARVWNADGSGAPVVLSGHTDELEYAAFSPDGTRVATASQDQSIRVWQSDGSGTPMVMRGHLNPVLSLLWNDDGTRIASSSLDRTLRLWNIDKPAAAVVLETSAPVIAMAFQEGGHKMLTIESDNSTETWIIDVGMLKQHLLQAHADCVPPRVRAMFLGEAIPTAFAEYASCERSYGRTVVDLEGIMQ